MEHPKIGGIYKDTNEGESDHFKVTEVTESTVHIIAPEGGGMYRLKDFHNMLQRGEIVFLE